MPSAPRDRSGFHVAIFCALSTEAQAVRSVFDVCWEDRGKQYDKAEGDYNSYTTGVIEKHNVVLVHMDGIGMSRAASAAADLRSSFTQIKLAIVVGFCGVVPVHPETKKEIFLGDIIISTAVFQYDLRRQYPGGFQRRKNIEDSLGPVSREIGSFLQKLKTQQFLTKFRENLTNLISSPEFQRESPHYVYPGAAHDRLYKASYVHCHQPATPCKECQPDVGVCRQTCSELGCEDKELDARDRNASGAELSTESKIHTPGVHLGHFGSANTTMKSGQDRDDISKSDKITAFDMEAAGVWKEYSTIVIKAACDYADSHKNKTWQDHAAVMAAAGLRVFLKEWVIPKQIFDRGESFKPVRHVLFNSDLESVSHDSESSTQLHNAGAQSSEANQRHGIQSENFRYLASDSNINSAPANCSHVGPVGLYSVTDVAGPLSVYQKARSIGIHYDHSESSPMAPLIAEERLSWKEYHKSLGFEQMYDQQRSIGGNTAGTCEWLLTSPEYEQWMRQNGLFLVRGFPGCGKSTLIKYTLEQELARAAKDVPQALIISFFFYNSGTELETSINGMLRSLISQLVEKDEQSRELFHGLCHEIFPDNAGKRGDLVWITHDLKTAFEKLLVNCSARRSVRIFIDAVDECRGPDREDLNRLIHYLNRSAQAYPKKIGIFMTNRTWPDGQIETDFQIQLDTRTQKDIQNFLASELRLPDETQKDQDELKNFLQDGARGSFLWLALVIPQIHESNSKGDNLALIKSRISQCPEKMDQFYGATLEKIDKVEIFKTSALIQWMCFASRPLSTEELRIALTIHASDTLPSMKEYTHGDNFDFIPNENKLKKKVMHLSRGLVSFSSATKTKNVTIVRFYHESIKTFMISRGLEIIASKMDPAHDLHREANAQLTNTCIRFLSTEEVVTAMWDNDKEYLGRHPFFEYARDHWYLHALEAEKANTAGMVDWPSHKALSAWIHTMSACTRTDRRINRESRTTFVKGTQPIHIAARYGLVALARKLLGDRSSTDEISATQSADEMDINVPTRALPKSSGPRVQTFAPAVKSISTKHDILPNAHRHGREKSNTGPKPYRFGTMGDMRVRGEKAKPKRTSLLHINKPQKKHRPAIKQPRHEDVIDVRDAEARTPLFLATYEGRLSMIRLLCEQGADVHLRDRMNCTTLLVASMQNHSDAAKYLLEQGANTDVHKASEGGWTPLHAASYQGHLEVVKLLLDHGADIHATSNCDWMRLSTMSFEADLELHMDLSKLEANSDIRIISEDGQTPLYIASARGHLNVVRHLVEHGAETDIRTATRTGQTPLYAASAQGRLDVLKYLLEQGAAKDIHTPNNNGWTPLCTASDGGHFKVVKHLLENGAETDIHTPTRTGQTPLYSASTQGHLDVVKYLLERGAAEDIYTPNDSGWTPLCAASNNGHLEVVKHLLENGAETDIHTPTRTGQTPLYSASTQGRLDVVKYLLERGAAEDIHTPNENGWTPLCAASENGHFEVVKYLLEHGAAKDIHTPSYSGWTPLNAATRYNHLEVAQILLEAGVDANTRGSYGQTPLICSIVYGCKKISRLLTECSTDISLIDDYGRTAADWLKLLNIDDEWLRNFCSGSETPLETNVERLSTSIVSLSAAIVNQQMEKAITLFNNLGYFFLALNDIEHAYVAFQQQIKTSPQDASVEHDVRCDLCSTSPIKGGRFICKTCPDTDLCASCMGRYREGKHFAACNSHDYLEIPGFNSTLMDGDSLREWLLDNMDRYAPSPLID